MHSSGTDQETDLEAVEVYLSLGANLGDRYRAIANGLQSLSDDGVTVERCSSLYETEPVGYEDQPWFLNLVAQARTSLPVRSVLEACKSAESKLRRVPSRRFGPRSLDVDILLYGTASVAEDDLIVPHPRMRERRFVLIPLLELEPGLRDPIDGLEYAELLRGLDTGKKVLRSTRNVFLSQ